MSKTPPPPFNHNNMQNTKANHQMWELLTDKNVMNCIPLFPSDPSHKAGYGLEHNYPGVHCLIKDARDSVGAVHRQIDVCLLQNYHRRFPVDQGEANSWLQWDSHPGSCHISSCSVYIEKMNDVSASQLFVRVVLFSSCILSHWQYTLSLSSSTIWLRYLVVQTKAGTQTVLRWWPASEAVLTWPKALAAKIHVPVKETIILFSPPFTCNNRVFNETKTSKPPKDGFDLKANVCITTSMSKLMMDETLKDLA